MKENVTVFTKSAIFLLFILEGFWQFFKPNNLKSSHGKSKFLLLSCREYVALGKVFVFSPNLKFFYLLIKKGQNFDFFSRKTHFLHFFVKNSKNIRLS